MVAYARHGTVVRLIYLAVALAYWPVMRLGQLLRRGGGSAIVLLYHEVTDEQRDGFAWQMAHIADRAIDARDLSKGTGRGAGRPRICVTFDDGFVCLYTNVLPMTWRLGIPVTVFPVVGRLGDRAEWKMWRDRPDSQARVMSAELLREADRFRCRFGSHTQTHPDLTHLPWTLLEGEIAGSKANLEVLLSTAVEDFALPYGAYDGRTIAMAFNAGYKRVFSCDPQVFVAGRPRQTIGRFAMSPEAWRIEFTLTCAGAYAWLGPWRQWLRRRREPKATRIPTIKEGTAAP